MGLLYERYRHLRHARPRRPFRQTALDGHPLRHHHAFVQRRPAHAQQLRRRVPHPLRLGMPRPRSAHHSMLWTVDRHHRRHPLRRLHAHHDPARLLRRPRQHRPPSDRGWDLNAREHLALWPMVALFVIMGVASPYFMQRHRPARHHLANVPAPFDNEQTAARSFHDRACLPASIRGAQRGHRK